MNRRPPSHLDRIAAERIAELLDEACPDRRRPGLLVALSGGPDSVALLLGARVWAERSGAGLVAAHLDHGLRGDEADADAAFCRELCTELDVVCHVARVDVRKVAGRRGLGLEEAGRHERHAFLRRLLAADPELDAIATGHHLDDQAETIVMRLFRGTGLTGLQGIASVQEPFIRPLLNVSRRQIVAFLEERGQPWRTDTSNMSGDNLRARLRRELVPVVRDIFGPGAEQVPARLAELVGPDARLLDRLAATATAELTTDGDGGAALDIPGLLDLDRALARRVLRAFLRPAGAEAIRAPELIHIDSVLDWLAQGTSGTGLDLGQGLQVRRDFDRLTAHRTGPGTVPLRSAADYRIVVARAEACTGNEYEADDAGGRGAPGDGPWRLTVPADCLRGSVRVRHPAAGDGIGLLGLDGTKSVGDLLRERQVPAESRSRILVVTDDEGILWVVGLARAERTRLLPTTAKAVTIYLAERQPRAETR